jgi:hypothetical protein
VASPQRFFRQLTYATEERVIHVEENGEKKVVKVPTFLLDSVQSQANRMELALLQGYREGQLKFPLIEVDFSDCAGDGTPSNNLAYGLLWTGFGAGHSLVC